MKRLHHAAVCSGLLFLLLATGCSDSGMQTDDSPVLYTADQLQLLVPSRVAPKADLVSELHTIAVSPGEQAEFSDGLIYVNVEPGCVTAPMTLTADWQGDEESPEYGYDFGPEGTVFAQPIQVSYALDLVDDMDAVDTELLSMFYDREDGLYELIPSVIEFEPVIVWDEECQCEDEDIRIWVRASVDHFSKYIIATGPPTGGSLKDDDDDEE